MDPKEKPAQPNQINIELTEDIADGIYSNLAIIQHSNQEFVVDFIKVMPGVPKAKVKARIVLTPQHAKRFMRAMAEASKAMHRDRELVYRVMEKKLRIKDRSILEASYNIEMKVMEPRLDLKAAAIQPMIEEVAKTNPRANEMKPQDLMDRRYLAEMESSGFFNQVWNEKR